MMNGEKTRCLLCGKPAERGAYRNPNQRPNTIPGWKYDCSGDCPPYALQEPAHHHIELFIKGDKEREIIAYFLKDRYDSRGYSEPYFEIYFDDLIGLGLVRPGSIS
jgi:hypothetical protein